MTQPSQSAPGAATPPPPPDVARPATPVDCIQKAGVYNDEAAAVKCAAWKPAPRCDTAPEPPNPTTHADPEDSPVPYPVPSLFVPENPKRPIRGAANIQRNPDLFLRLSPHFASPFLQVRSCSSVNRIKLRTSEWPAAVVPRLGGTKRWPAIRSPTCLGGTKDGARERTRTSTPFGTRS